MHPNPSTRSAGYIPLSLRRSASTFGGAVSALRRESHQRAALYADGSGLGIAGAKQLQGKELSYNNLVDLDACWELTEEFDEPMVAIIKHTNPCGAAMAHRSRGLPEGARCDPVSAFGGVIGINREVDGAAAEEIAKLFVEAIAAPAFSPEARAHFAAKRISVSSRFVLRRPAPS